MNHREIASRIARFRALHEGPEPLLLPNPWDPGTARLLAHLGFEALATTSLGVANALGRARASAEEVLENVRAIADATPLPVNADLENGWADEPREAAAILARAFACGAAGGSLEDATGDPRKPVYDFAHAVERVHAGVEAARALPAPFVFTARAEGLLYGAGDLDEIVRRLQAFERAGADVLYAPGLRTLEQMGAVVGALKKPLNVVMGFADPAITADQLRDAGVRRISIGGALSRVALRAFLESAREMRAGRFGWVNQMATIGELRAAFRAGTP